MGWVGSTRVPRSDQKALSGWQPRTAHRPKGLGDQLVININSEALHVGAHAKQRKKTNGIVGSILSSDYFIGRARSSTSTSISISMLCARWADQGYVRQGRVAFWWHKWLPGFFVAFCLSFRAFSTRFRLLRAPSHLCRNARVNGHMTTAVHEMNAPPPPPPPLPSPHPPRPLSTDR